LVAASSSRKLGIGHLLVRRVGTIVRLKSLAT
jgi:hypothetical protein